MPFRSIRARLTAAFCLALVLLVIPAIGGLVWYSRRSAERNADTLLRAAVNNAVVESSDPKEPYSPFGLIREEHEDLSSSGLVLSITDRSGHIVGKSNTDAPTLDRATHKGWRIASAKLGNGDTIVVGMPWKKTEAELRSHTALLIWLGAFVVVIASVGAWLLVGRTLMPISVLAREARAASADDLAVRLEPPSDDYEMIELVDTLNGLLRRITQTAAAKGRFYSAASHELRTPLQALSGHLELALSKDRTSEEYKEAVNEAYSQTRRLISLVRTLLFLYQLESSTALPPKEQVDLAEVCRRVLSQFHQTAEERELEINTDLVDAANLMARPDHVDILVQNLVENAVNYSAPQTTVNFYVGRSDNVLTLRVENTTAGSGCSNPKELLEPFSRPDSSRNRKTGGYGLGLAICKSIAEANGWQLELSSTDKSFEADVVFSA